MTYKNTLAFTSLNLFNRMDLQTTTRDYRNRQTIFTQGDKADAMFYVQNGNVKLTVASKSGKKAVIAILRHGDFFWRGLPGYTVAVDVYCNGDSTLHHRPGEKSGYRPHHSSRTRFCEALYLISVISYRTNRR